MNIDGLLLHKLSGTKIHATNDRTDAVIHVSTDQICDDNDQCDHDKASINNIHLNPYPPELTVPLSTSTTAPVTTSGAAFGGL